ncbi:hypothetical protein NL676_019147 [Syzygium grande]|nr:hypothetical protein NL676_019147 [Syzygium grande]
MSTAGPFRFVAFWCFDRPREEAASWSYVGTSLIRGCPVLRRGLDGRESVAGRRGGDLGEGCSPPLGGAVMRIKVEPRPRRPELGEPLGAVAAASRVATRVGQRPVQFNISSFDNSKDIHYDGVAEARGYIDLTPKVHTPQSSQVGQIRSSEPIHIWDSVTGRRADFSTHFSFTIEPFYRTIYSDGLAFFLAPTGFTIPLNSAGGYLGLFNSSIVNCGPWNRIVMVEFDTYVNSYFDPPERHIGININSLSSIVHTSWDPESHGGNATNVVVTYNSTSKNLSVFCSFDGEPFSSDKKSTSLSFQIDLAEALPESVVIGISASYGDRGERHKSIHGGLLRTSMLYTPID